MNTPLPEDDELPLIGGSISNARSKLADAPAAPAARSKLADAPAPVAAAPAPPQAAPDPLPVKTPKRVRIILEEDSAIPPVGLFIQPNGHPYVLMAGVEASVPQEVISVLNDAVISVPVVDPISQRVTGYRERLRFPYRRLD